MAPRETEIIYFLDHYPVLSQTFVTNEIEGLRQQGVHVQVAALRKGDNAASFEADVYFQPNGLKAIVGLVASLLKRPRFALDVLARIRFRGGWRDRAWLFFAPQVADYLTQHPNAYIHTHFALRAAAILSSAATLQGRKWGVTTHAYDIFVDNHALKERVRGGSVYTISEHNKRVLEVGHRISVDGVYACGVDETKYFRNTPIVETLDPSRGLLFVGRLVEKKGLTVLLHALVELHCSGLPFAVTIVGEGPLAPMLEKRATELGIQNHVQFEGASSHEAILQKMRDQPILVVPSVVASNDDVDGIPVVILEGMASGCPVVASDLASIREVVTGETGWLFAAGSAHALAAAISSMIKDEQLVKSRVCNAREHVLRQRTVRRQAAFVRALAESGDLNG